MVHVDVQVHVFAEKQGQLSRQLALQIDSVSLDVEVAVDDLIVLVRQFNRMKNPEGEVETLLKHYYRTEAYDAIRASLLHSLESVRKRVKWSLPRGVAKLIFTTLGQQERYYPLFCSNVTLDTEQLKVMCRSAGCIKLSFSSQVACRLLFHRHWLRCNML